MTRAATEDRLRRNRGSSTHGDRKPAGKRQEAACETIPAALRSRIKETVRHLEPAAEIILYGSRARGDAGPDSDWDLLVLLDGAVDRARERAVWHRLYALELDLEEVLCPVVFSREDWESSLYKAMPFHQNVDRDGMAL